MAVQIRISPSFKKKVLEVAKRTKALYPEAKSKVGARGELIRALSHNYFVLLRNNLVSQKYPQAPAPYNQDYLNWKLRNYGFTDPWFLGGDLFRNIVIYERDGGRSVGIPKGRRAGGKSWFFDKGNQSKGYNSREITYYGYLIENGSPGGKIPARPVFGPTLADFVKKDAEDIINKMSKRMFSKWEIR